MADSIIEVHRAEPVAESTSAGQHKINQEHPSGRSTYLGSQLVEPQACYLGRIDVAVLHLIDGNEGKREDHDAKAAYPLCYGAPEEQTFRQSVYLVDASGARRGEAAHGLEESTRHIHVGKIEERHHADDGEDNPGEGNDEEVVGSTHAFVLFPTAQEDTERADGYRSECREQEAKPVFLIIEEGY